MDRQTIIDRLLDHYGSPRNYGPLAQADVVVAGGVPDCGDTVTIYLQVDATGERVARVTFEGHGCSISQAAASILSELAVGMPLADLALMAENDLLDNLGREVVSSRPRCATLALDTLKTAIARYRSRYPAT